MPSEISRRDFFLRSAFYGGSLWVALNVPRPRALRAAAESTEGAVLDEAEWKAVEVLTGRIIPTDHEPGAIEAGCVHFIDKALANEDSDAQPVYTAGLAGLASASKKRFGNSFVDLEPEQQDEMLVALESGKVDGWPESDVRPDAFFETVRTHTIVGFLADPKYGGNQDYVGWKVVDYPGPRHSRGGYTPEQMTGEAKIRAIWGENL